MPITLRKFNAQVKDPDTGEMVPAGLLSSDSIEAIEAAETAAVTAVEGKQAAAEAAIELKGETTLASIPVDYTELNNEVDDVKTQIDAMDDTVNGVITTNYVEGKKLDNDGTLSDDETVCVSEKIPYTWTGSTRYYCNDNTSTKYAICFYDSSDTLLKKVQLPSSTGGIDYRAYDAENNVEGTVSYVRFSFKKGTTGEVRKNVNPDYELIWAATSTTSGGLINDISEMQDEIDALQETAPTEGELESIETDLNGIKTDLNGVTSFNYEDGKAIDSNGDVIDPAVGKSLTEMISIDGIPYTNPRFTYSDVSGDASGTYYICFYDSDKAFIKSFSNNQNTGYRAISLETQVTGAKYVRFSFKTGVEANIAEHTDTENIWWYAHKTVVKGLKEKVDAAVVQNEEQVQAKAATVTNATITAIENIDIRKNLDIEFRGDITSFTNVVVGHGYDHNYAAYIKVDSTNLTIYKDVLVEQPDQTYVLEHTQVAEIPHGLTVGTYLHVLIQQGDAGTATVTINTASGRFKQENIEFNGRRGNVFATVAGTLTNVTLTASIRDLNKSVWIFGDSYQQLNDQTKWPYYLQNDGYLNNCLFSGFPGANSNDEIASFRKLIALAQPKYVVWGLGMNNSDNSAINVSWKQCVNEVINTCDNMGVTVVLTTIPCVPDRDHTYKNAYITNPPEGSPTVGKRYIDFARCVGAESAGSYWYNWGDDPASPDATAMLLSDKLHPSKYGAMALYAELLADMPEVMG